MMASNQMTCTCIEPPNAGATDRAASGDLRPNQPAQGTRQPRPIPMGARTEALHRAQKRRRVDARRATSITRSIWILAHLLILAAILSAPSRVHNAVVQGEPFPILLALVLIGTNVWLYTWVSISNPGIVTVESNAKRAARAGQQAAANTATTTAAQLAANTRPDALLIPAPAGASTISSMGISSAITGTLAAKGTGFATPAGYARDCVTSASPSTNTPTTWHTAKMSVPDSSPAQPPSPMRLLRSVSPGPGGYGRVPVTDDADDERFHDGLPPDAAGQPATTACGSATQASIGKYLTPLSIPSRSPGPAPPGAWSKPAMFGGMRDLGSVMSGAGDTSRLTGTTHGDGGFTSSAAFGDSPGALSTGQHSTPDSPSGTGPGLSPPTLLRGNSAGDTSASHFGFRRTLAQNPQPHNSYAVNPPASNSSPTNAPSRSATTPAADTAAPLRPQFRSSSAGAPSMPPAGPVAEARVPQASREWLAGGRVAPNSPRGVGVPEAVSEARSHLLHSPLSQPPSVNGGVSTTPPAATLVEMTSSLQHCAPSPCTLAAHAVSSTLNGVLERASAPTVSTSGPEIVAGGDFDTSAIVPQSGTRARRISQHSVRSHTLDSDASTISEMDSRAASPTGFAGRSPTAGFQPLSSLNMPVTVSAHPRNGDLHSSSSVIGGNGCMHVRGNGSIAKSANTAVRVLHRSMHSVGRWLTMLAGFRFGSQAYDDEDALLELDELGEMHALHAVHLRNASADSAGKQTSDQKLSAAAAAACFACVRPLCVEEDIPEAGPVAEGRFTRGQEQHRAPGGAAKQQGQERALDVFGTPLVGFGSKNSSDMMGGLVGVEMLSYEPSQATELNPFVDDQEMGAPRGSMARVQPFAHSSLSSGLSASIGGIGGAMPLAVTANDPLAPKIDVSEDPECSQNDVRAASASDASSGGRAARAVASVFRSTTKSHSSPDSPQIAEKTNNGGVAVSSTSSPRKSQRSSPVVQITAGTAHAASTSHVVSAPAPETLETRVETVVVPDEDTPQPPARACTHEHRTTSEPMVISIDNPLRSATPDRRPPHPANVAQASTSAAPRAGRLLLSPFEQQASPAQTPPQRCTTPAGLAAMSCGAQPTQRDVGPPLQGISTRRKMCVVPDPRATYRSHLRGSLGLSNMSLGVGGPPTATAAPDWYSPTNPGRDCPYCELWQPMRGKHCHDCGHCVRRFDHHCAWIGNCVGERNHRLFFSYLTAQFALLVWAAYQLVSAFGTASRWNVWVLHQLHLLLAMVVLILFSLFVASLWLYHMYLAFTNQTTYEASFRDRVPYLKDLPEHTLPFSHSLRANLHQFCFPDPNAVYTIKLSRSW